jgi:hypothetical protein
MQNAATEYPNLYSAAKTPLTSLVFAYKQIVLILLLLFTTPAFASNINMVTVWILPS